MNQQTSNMQAGYTRVLNNLVVTGYKIKEVIPINNGRYLIVKGEPENIMIIYKREFFLKFGIIFKDEGASGLGESINVLDLQFAIQKEVQRIYFIYENGHIYSIPVQDFLANSFKRENEEGKITRSVSIRELKREFS